MSLEESSLGDSTILLFWLNKHDRLVFKVIVDDQVSNSVVLKSALNNVLFAETVESQDLKDEILNKERFYLPVCQA